MVNYHKPKSLNAQIKDVEQQILNRQREVDFRTIALVEKIQQQIIATPATLLLAGSIGFILGELTKCCSSANHDQRQAAEITPLRIPLNLWASARILYAVLPLAWMMQSGYRPSTSSQIPEQQTRSTVTKRSRTSL